jgi:integrase/recombinase XerD
MLCSRGHSFEQGADQQFRASGIARKRWRNADAARRIFKEAFEAIGLPAFNPHSFRHALVRLGEKKCRSPEEFKAWSQNLGHNDVLTTFSSYGTVPPQRQAEIIKSLANIRNAPDDPEVLAHRVAELVSRHLATKG